MSNPYYINAGDMTSAVVQLVNQFRRENPGLNVFEATFGDGSTVKIRLKKKKQIAKEEEEDA